MYEQIFIDFHEPAYNMVKTAGSQLGYRHTDATKAKMSEAAKRTKNFTGKRHTAESKALISANRSGKSSGPFTESRRKKISDAMKGRVISDEQKRAISEKLKGHSQSRETIEKRKATIRQKFTLDSGKLKMPSRRLLNEVQVREILANRGVISARKMAPLYGVSRAVIDDILNGKNYRWVE